MARAARVRRICWPTSTGCWRRSPPSTTTTYRHHTINQKNEYLQINHEKPIQ